ncbi:hypothetical protein FC93_GL000415 [Lactobacillus kefiranofaciens subsp. kefiranofaciens DSM 5016 = JCM 6985]|nr:hypothetical protein FC93_GL000415 [Lactobacillus kefiranofaciens subsp. kefiranofaciens DSM 5016 = JCM 6985]
MKATNAPAALHVAKISNSSSTSASTASLPKTGKSKDGDLTAIIAGDLAVSLGLIGLAGAKRKNKKY